MKKIIIVFTGYVIIFIVFGYITSYKRRPKNFSQAKTVAVAIHRNAVSFYCGCPITWYGKIGTPNLVACGYKSKHHTRRAQRIEWEHVVPAWDFGHLLPCWQKGGRSACTSDLRFNKIEADLHNLQPVIGELNRDRKNFAFCELPNNHSFNYGRCNFKIDYVNKLAEPPRRSKGAIARIYLYMHERYRLNYTTEQLALFEQWNKSYPVTDWECKRDELIAFWQGNRNEMVARACQQKLNAAY